jgi:hypothetical protein
MKKHLLTISILLLGTLISQAQWQQDVRLTNDPGMSATTPYSNARCIASSGDTVHVVWSDNRVGGNYEIFYKRSVDGGLTWGADIRISNNVYVSSNPSISISGSVVHVVWDDNRDGNYEIYYNRSTDGGVSWGTDTRLTNGPATSQNPCVSSAGSLVFVAWTDNREAGGNFVVYYLRSTDGGISWGAETRLGGSWNPAVSISGKVVHVVWQDARQLHPGVYYKRSVDEGITWGADIPLTINDIAYSDSPSLSVSGSDVNVVFRDSRNSIGTGYEIFYKHSTDGGITWNSDTQLSNFHVTVYNPSVSVSGSGVHVVWADNHEGNFEIYYDRSADGGKSWESVTRLTNNTAVSFYPFVAASNTGVHVIWQENRDGNYEIYYKRNPTGNMVGLNELTSSESQISVFPNPFTNEISFSTTGNEPYEVIIYDITSKRILQKKFTSIAALNTSTLSKGIYMYEVKGKNCIQKKGKIIKE